MAFHVPLFGDGRLVWRDAELQPQSISADEDLDAVIPGRQLAREEFGTAQPRDALARARRGAEGAAVVLRDQYAELGHPITLEAARDRVASARSRAARRKEA
jgi:hypothetical protein